mmetsp:Transcript_39049/g.96750  ORF Transcript_39049/g.96750 Transcript_39049/m.96750 type:complete len:312 (+) Transcript_39049:1795-2730(+)
MPVGGRQGGGGGLAAVVDGAGDSGGGVVHVVDVVDVVVVAAVAVAVAVAEHVPSLRGGVDDAVAVAVVDELHARGHAARLHRRLHLRVHQLVGDVLLGLQALDGRLARRARQAPANVRHDEVPHHAAALHLVDQRPVVDGHERLHRLAHVPPLLLATPVVVLHPRQHLRGAVQAVGRAVLGRAADELHAVVGQDALHLVARLLGAPPVAGQHDARAALLDDVPQVLHQVRLRDARSVCDKDPVHVQKQDLHAAARVLPPPPLVRIPLLPCLERLSGACHHRKPACAACLYERGARRTARRSPPPRVFQQER